MYGGRKAGDVVDVPRVFDVCGIDRCALECRDNVRCTCSRVCVIPLYKRVGDITFSFHHIPVCAFR